MDNTYNFLILGASYGSVIAIKILAAGHNVHLVCLEKEAKLINEEGISISIPSLRGKSDIILDSNNLPGQLSAGNNFDLDKIDICFFAMQEHQYVSDKKISDLVLNISKKKIPIVSVMNIPPAIFLQKIDNIDTSKMQNIYDSYELWRSLDKNLISISSPDPQAFKPNINKHNFLKVRLASNFKFSKFHDEKSNKILNQLEHDVKKLKIPIYFNIFDTPFISLAKWPMLIAGNYRCIKKNSIVSIREAISEDLNLSKEIYNSVSKFCLNLGALKENMISFETYFKRSKLLDAPSSVARTIEANNKKIERFDLMLNELAKQKKFEIFGLSEINHLINQRISKIN